MLERMTRLYMSQDDAGAGGGDTNPPTNLAPQPQQDTTDYRAAYTEMQRSYAGLQGHAQKVKKDYDALTLRERDRVQELEALKLERESEKTVLTVERDTFRQKAETEAQKAARLEAEVTLSRTILGEYPELAGMYAKGLINTAGMDADGVKAYLTGLKETIGAQANALAKNQLKGSTPTPPRPDTNQNDDPATLRAALMKARTGTPEYAELQQRYIDALTNAR
jgi:hypothetical protein